MYFASSLIIYPMKIQLITALFLTLSSVAFAQESTDTLTVPIPKKVVPARFYAGNGLDLAMLSTAFVERPGQESKLTAPRFTALVNIGFTLNYDVSRHFGIFSGLGLRNMGFIESFNDEDSTIKRRVYSLGVPLGFKFGNLRNRNFVFLGGGADFPFHYKEKRFTKRSDKQKTSEWFGDQTPRVLPFVFVGYSFDPGITLKAQYYPTNFLETDYTNSAGVKPFTGYKVNLLLLSLGIDIHYGQYKIQEREYQREKKQVNVM